MNREALKRLGASLAFRLLIVVLILYTIYHCVAAFSDRVVTDVITNGVDRRTVRAEAIVFRDETVLTVQGGNYLCSYPQQNGAKVNAQSTLAELYATSQDADTRRQTQTTLLALDRQIALAAALPTGDKLSLLPSLQTTAREQLIANNRLISAGTNIQTIHDTAYELLLTLNRIAALTGESGGSAALIASLRAERQKLLMSASYTATTMTVTDIDAESTGGYFFYANTVDGYEEVFQRSALASMSVLDYDALLQQPRKVYPEGTTVVGKLVKDFYWSIVLPVSYDIQDELETGAAYDVIFWDNGEVTVPMTLDRVISLPTDGRALLVLTSTTTPKNFSYTRFSNVSLVLEQIEGYRVPETALVTQNGQDGVYILDGGRVSFRAIDIISRGQGYVLAYAPSRAEREDEQDDTYHYNRYLDIRDVVITDGKDLYDGKYIE